MGKYTQASINAREYGARKVKKPLYTNMSDFGRELKKLVELVPNWETYLTDKQLEAVRLYLQHGSSFQAGNQLGINGGSAYGRLFGGQQPNGTHSDGAVGRLRKVHKMLEESGYYEDQKAK